MSIFTPLIIIFILLLNYYLYKRNSYSKSFFLLSSSFLIIYILFAIIIYYNNLSNGFEHGILFGDVANNHFCDEYKYYIDSDILLNHLKNGDISAWLHKELPIYEFTDPNGHASYGNYNIFVIFLTFIKAIGIKSTLDLILIKLVVYIPTSIFLYKTSKLYLNEKLSLLSAGIFSILPGYILCNSLLMRDNIVICLISILIYYILSSKINYKSLILILIVSILLFEFRSYSLLVIIACIIFTFKNNKRILSFIDIFYFIAIVATIYFFVNFNFQENHSNALFSLAQITYLQEIFTTHFGSGINMLINLFTQLIIHIIYDPPLLGFLNTGLIYLILYCIGNILGTILTIASCIAFIYFIIKIKDKKAIFLFKFTAYFTILTGLIVLSKDLFIINRLALLWLPLFIIILLYVLTDILNKPSKY
ncbi:hypothetical protein [Clostridium sp.]|uniref:hypothetical protein n=1 Tax=Clostridium sp. TaxID=1506 RepID=UPI00352160B3